MYEKLYIPLGGRGANVQRSLGSLSVLAKTHRDLALLFAGCLAGASSLAYGAGKKVQELREKDVRTEALKKVVKANAKVAETQSWAVLSVAMEKGKGQDLRLSDLATIINGGISTGDAGGHAGGSRDSGPTDGNGCTGGNGRTNGDGATDDGQAATFPQDKGSYNTPYKTSVAGTTPQAVELVKWVVGFPKTALSGSAAAGLSEGTWARAAKPDVQRSPGAVKEIYGGKNDDGGGQTTSAAAAHVAGEHRKGTQESTLKTAGTASERGQKVASAVEEGAAAAMAKGAPSADGTAAVAKEGAAAVVEEGIADAQQAPPKRSDHGNR